MSDRKEKRDAYFNKFASGIASGKIADLQCASDGSAEFFLETESGESIFLEIQNHEKIDSTSRR